MLDHFLHRFEMRRISAPGEIEGDSLGGTDPPKG